MGFSLKAFLKERSSPKHCVYMHFFQEQTLYHSQTLFAYLIWTCKESTLTLASWLSGIGSGQGYRPKMMTKLWCWKFHCPWNNTYQIQPIFCFFPSFWVSFVLAAVRKDYTYIYIGLYISISTLSPVHKQIEVLADDTASSSSEAKAKCHLGCQVLLHMSTMHPRSGCSWLSIVLQQLWSKRPFEEDSYLSHHWPIFDTRNTHLFLHQDTQKVLTQIETLLEKHPKIILLGCLSVWEICRITNHLTSLWLWK